VEQEQFIWDDRVWGSILYTMDESTSAARSRRVHLWAASLGFHPGLVSQQWFDLYGDGQTPYLVHPDELPKEGRPPVVAHFDLEHGAVTDVFEYRDGSFATPPTFVPRRGTDSIGDGYIVLLVHRDGDKEVHVFDAADLAKGPIARASAVGFNPPLQLHSWWAPPCAGAPASEYRVPIARDVLGAVIGGPGVMLRMVRSMLAIRSAIQQARASGRAE
jgi:all-trans-8'-apo-beta-carotenal 15,15'-oxygenase